MNRPWSWIFVALAWGALALAVEAAPLELVEKIPLGEVKGRLDHLTVDIPRQRLLLAELGNGTVGVVDLRESRVLRRLTGFSEPQGIAYVPSADAVYVANGGDGTVRVLRGDDFTESGRIELGDDADNVRVDTAADRVYVGFGSGGIAVIDPKTRARAGELPLPYHPEGFQLETGGSRIFVNVPRAKGIVVLDRVAGRPVATWPLAGGTANFPMEFDRTNRRILVALRSPARLNVFAAADGSLVASEELCGDADDVFWDAKRRRVYVSCGEGFIEAFEERGRKYRSLGRIPTAAGARTALLVPEWDRLYLAVRASSGVPAAIWTYRLVP